jgi:hypothetical protein
MAFAWEAARSHFCSILPRRALTGWSGGDGAADPFLVDDPVAALFCGQKVHDHNLPDVPGQ